MRSMGEVRCAADMDDRGLKWDYENDTLDYIIEATYTPDFTVRTKTNKGKRVLLEYKGKLTKGVRTQLIATRKCNPKERIALIFERANNKLTSRPNSRRYWRWAELSGFPWSEAYAKDEWFTEKFWKDFEKENKIQ